MNKANELEKLNKDSESNEYNTTREFSNGYEGHMSLGTYFEVYGKVINSKPSSVAFTAATLPDCPV